MQFFKLSGFDMGIELGDVNDVDLAIAVEVTVAQLLFLGQGAGAADDGIKTGRIGDVQLSVTAYVTHRALHSFICFVTQVAQAVVVGICALVLQQLVAEVAVGIVFTDAIVSQQIITQVAPAVPVLVHAVAGFPGATQLAVVILVPNAGMGTGCVAQLAEYASVVNAKVVLPISAPDAVIFTVFTLTGMFGHPKAKGAVKVFTRNAGMLHIPAAQFTPDFEIRLRIIAGVVHRKQA
jgi:hypothetical protein